MSGMGAREICGHSRTRTEDSGVGTMLRHILKSNQSLKEMRKQFFKRKSVKCGLWEQIEIGVVEVG